MTRAALLSRVRELLVRVEDRLQGLDPDGDGILPVSRDEDRLDGAAALIRFAELLLALRQDARPRPEGSAPRCIAVGARFYSEGLGGPCRVLAVDGHTLEFETETLGDDELRTDVPMDLAARHFASGRWRLLSP